MEIRGINQAAAGAGDVQYALDGLKSVDGKVSTADAARQFEAILLRQMVDESMGKMFSRGPGGHVYGYMITDALAEGISRAGGLGLGRVIEAQLTERRSIGPRVAPGAVITVPGVDVRSAAGAFKRSEKVSEGEEGD